MSLVTFLLHSEVDFHLFEGFIELNIKTPGHLQFHHLPDPVKSDHFVNFCQERIAKKTYKFSSPNVSPNFRLAQIQIQLVLKFHWGALPFGSFWRWSSFQVFLPCNSFHIFMKLSKKSDNISEMFYSLKFQIITYLARSTFICPFSMSLRQFSYTHL